ncbi:zinc finger, CCHC-type containing protein [Tanacetum coccineum]
MTRISDIKDSRSTSGYVFTLGGAAMSWKSSKQTVIAKSTIESEFIALDKCGEEAEWLRQFVEDIPMWPIPVMDIQEKDKNRSQNDKTEHENGKTVREAKRNARDGVLGLDTLAIQGNDCVDTSKGCDRFKEAQDDLKGQD